MATLWAAVPEEQVFRFDLPQPVVDALIKQLKEVVCPARVLTSPKTDEFVGNLSASWRTIALCVTRLVQYARIDGPEGPTIPRDFHELAFDERPSAGQIDAAIFAVIRQKPKTRDQFVEALDSLLTKADVMKHALAFWSPLFGLGPYYRWMLGAHLFAMLYEDENDDTWTIAKLWPRSLRARVDPCANSLRTKDDHDAPEFLGKLLQGLSEKAAFIDPGASVLDEFVERPFFSSFDAPQRFMAWLKTGKASPSNNFQLLRKAEFFTNLQRDEFIDQLIRALAHNDPGKPLFVVEAPNSLNGLTALAGWLQELFYQDDRLGDISVLYLRANRFEAEDCHKSLGYYVGIILSWLDGKDVRAAPPIHSRAEIYDGLTKIRKAMSKHRLLLIVDGIESDRGAFEDVLNVINDNPISELISNLITPATHEITMSSEKSASDLNQTSSNVLVLSGGRWNKYSGIIRFKGMLPPISSDVVGRVLRKHGFRFADLVASILGDAICAETEAALLDVLIGASGKEALSPEEREKAKVSAQSETHAARMTLFKQVRKLLESNAPFALLMARFIALCPGGLRYTTMTRCFADFMSLSGSEWHDTNGSDSYDSVTSLFPMLFVTGDDEIVERDSFLVGSRQWEAGSLRPTKNDAVEDKLIGSWRERSIDIRFAEVRELLVADLIETDLGLWFQIHHILAEESLDQWTDNIRIAAPGEFGSIGAHRRLIGAIWHGLQSITFDERKALKDPPAKFKRRSFPEDPDKRFIYIATYLMRRCLEGDEEWLLARGFSRHRLRVSLLAATNSPERVRQYLANQYTSRPCSALEAARVNAGGIESWHEYFDKFAIQRPTTYKLQRKNTLSVNEKIQLFADHLISLGRAALDSGHGVLANKAVSALNQLNSELSHPWHGKDIATPSRKLLLDLLEYADQALDALDQMSPQLIHLGFEDEFPRVELFLEYEYPEAPFGFEALFKRASDDAETFAKAVNHDRLPECVSTLLRYAEALALKADAIRGDDNFSRNRSQYPAFLKAAYVYFFAERLRLMLRYESPFLGDLSAKPTRYLIRVSLKLAGLCYAASQIGIGHVSGQWEAAARDFWMQARHGADIYTRRFFKYDYERAYMNVLGASFERKRVPLIHLFNDFADVDTAIDDCFARALKHLQIADMTLSRLGYPLSPTRRFILERIKTYCAIGEWSASMPHESDLLTRMTTKALMSARADLALLNNLINTPETIALENGTRGSMFWNRLMEIQRCKIDQLVGNAPMRICN